MRKLKEVENVPALRRELKEYEKQIRQLERKKASLENKLDCAIQCPECKKYFKEVWLLETYRTVNYGKGGYFGDEIHEYNWKYNLLQCPSCYHTWSKQTGFYSTQANQQDEYKKHKEVDWKYKPMMVSVNSEDEKKYPKEKK